MDKQVILIAQCHASLAITDLDKALNLECKYSDTFKNLVSNAAYQLEQAAHKLRAAERG